MAVYRGYIRTIPDGAPVPNGTPVEFRAEADNALLASVTTSGGEFELVRNGTLPPHRITAVYSGETRVTSSKVTGMTGPLTLSALPYLLGVMTDGVIPDLWDEMEVTANGANMTLTVGTGAAHARGIVYDQRTAGSLTVLAADATNPRIDTAVVEVVPAGAGDDIEGSSTVRIVKGSPASSPTAPALTQSDTLWQIPLANIRVDAGTTAIAAGKVTDRREMVHVGLSSAEVNTLIRDWIEVAVWNGASGVNLGTVSLLGSEFPVLQVEDEYVQDLVAAMLEAGSNVTLTYNDTTGKLTISSAGGGGGGGGTSPARTYKDTNFTTSGRLASASGIRTLGTASISLPAGTYLIHSQVHLSLFNDDTTEGYATVFLDGNGAPAGSDESRRHFRTRGNASRQAVLTGRRLVTLGNTTTVSVSAKAQYHSGGASYLEDGVVFLWAE